MARRRSSANRLRDCIAAAVLLGLVALLLARQYLRKRFHLLGDTAAFVADGVDHLQLDLPAISPPTEAPEPFGGPGLDRSLLAEQWSRCGSGPHLKAVVFARQGQSERWREVQRALRSRGICPARFVACEARNVREERGSLCQGNVTACDASAGVRKGFSRWLCRGAPVAGTFGWQPAEGSFEGLTLLKAFAEVEPIVPEGGWMLFLQDGASVSPDLGRIRGGNFSALVSACLETSSASEHGLAYFNLCEPNCHRAGKAAVGFPGGELQGFVGDDAVTVKVDFQACGGTCSSAYAVAKDPLRALGRRRQRLLDLASAPATRAKVPGGESEEEEECPAVAWCFQGWPGAELLRHRCAGYGDFTGPLGAGGRLDASTGQPGRGSEVDYLDACGNLYGANLQSAVSGHFGIFT